MMISTKGRYALRLMVDIASRPEGMPVSLKEVATRQNISMKYLEQIVNRLCRAGLLESIRGPHGGYLLTRRLEDYTVGDILRVTEGSLAPVACLTGEFNECPRSDGCPTLPFWTGLRDVINQYVDSVTLKQLITGPSSFLE